MPKFRKKPVVIEARQFVTSNEADDVNMNALVGWIITSGGDATHNGTNIFIQTLEGEHRADVGDWIIRGVAREFYPCKNSIFEDTYEPE